MPIPSSLTRTWTIRESGTPVDSAGAIRFGPHQFLEFRLPEPRELSRLDVSLDSDDRYQIVVTNPTFSRSFWVGPALSAQGLMRYVKSLPQPMHDVSTIQIRTVSSDADYALGHLLLE